MSARLRPRTTKPRMCHAGLGVKPASAPYVTTRSLAFSLRHRYLTTVRPRRGFYKLQALPAPRHSGSPLLSTGGRRGPRLGGLPGGLRGL